MSELLFLLLPVAAAYGWYMGRRSGDQEVKSSKAKLSENYVAGLNYLLSDQADKAVDLFIDLIAVDTDTADTHLALASLFRQRGETDRAIKLHQNLIDRPTLPGAQRYLAKFELGLDYLAAGLYDRAEAIFSELLSHEKFRKKAARQLMHIYELTSEWEKAVDVAEKHKLATTSKLVHSTAHYMCEIAEKRIIANEPKSALKILRKALKYDPKCVRALILESQVLEQMDKYKAALQCLLRVPVVDIDFTREVLPRIKLLFEHLGNKELYIEFLQSVIDQRGGASVLIELAKHVSDTQGLAAAESMVERELVRSPTMKGFHHLMGYHIETADSDQARHSLKTLRYLVQQQIDVKPKFLCRYCGFSGSVLNWQCPSCKGWGGTKPIRGLDGE